MMNKKQGQAKDTQRFQPQNLVLHECKREDEREDESTEAGGGLRGQKGRRRELRVRKTGHILLHQHNKLLSLSLFLFNTFPTTSRAISKPQCARERERVCLMCVLEVRFGARAIKALLKHF